MKTFTEYLKEGEKRWKQTSMSSAEAIEKYGKENVKVKKGALRNGDDMVEVFVESVELDEATKGCSDCEYMKDETDGEIDTCDECAAEERAKTNEAGGYYTQPVYDMIEKHGYEKVMHELLTSLDSDTIQSFLQRAEFDEAYSAGDENEEGMVSNCCGAPIMDVYQGHGRCSDCKEMASAELEEESHEELDYLRKLAGI
jgi:hypothetical protein